MGITDDIVQIREFLLKQMPFARAVWFVDCPDIYASFLGFEKYQQYLSDKASSHHWFGIPVHEWRTYAERKSDIKPDLLFLNPGCRGIWIEMSDGEHEHFIYQDGLFYSCESESLFWNTLGMDRIGGKP